jgi:hypothetical protein
MPSSFPTIPSVVSVVMPVRNGARPLGELAAGNQQRRRWLRPVARKLGRLAGSAKHRVLAKLRVLVP